jgi:hypothetical protein
MIAFLDFLGQIIKDSERFANVLYPAIVLTQQEGKARHLAYIQGNQYLPIELDVLANGVYFRPIGEVRITESEDSTCGYIVQERNSTLRVFAIRKFDSFCNTPLYLANYIILLLSIYTLKLDGITYSLTAETIYHEQQEILKQEYYEEHQLTEDYIITMIDFKLNEIGNIKCFQTIC